MSVTDAMCNPKVFFCQERIHKTSKKQPKWSRDSKEYVRFNGRTLHKSKRSAEAKHKREGKALQVESSLGEQLLEYAERLCVNGLDGEQEEYDPLACDKHWQKHHRYQKDNFYLLYKNMYRLYGYYEPEERNGGFHFTIILDDCRKNARLPAVEDVNLYDYDVFERLYQDPDCFARYDTSVIDDFEKYCDGQCERRGEKEHEVVQKQMHNRGEHKNKALDQNVMGDLRDRIFDLTYDACNVYVHDPYYAKYTGNLEGCKIDGPMHADHQVRSFLPGCGTWSCKTWSCTTRFCDECCIPTRLEYDVYPVFLLKAAFHYPSCHQNISPKPRPQVQCEDGYILFEHDSPCLGNKDIWYLAKDPTNFGLGYRYWMCHRSLFDMYPHRYCSLQSFGEFTCSRCRTIINMCLRAFSQFVCDGCHHSSSTGWVNPSHRLLACSEECKVKLLARFALLGVQEAHFVFSDESTTCFDFLCNRRNLHRSNLYQKEVDEYGLIVY